MDDRLLRKLMANMKCAVCGQRYERANINVLGHREDLWFLSVFCPACRSQGLVAAVIKEGKLPEIMSDLTAGEQGRFTGTVSSDDVLDVHTFLTTFDGDFASLFSNGPEKSGGAASS